MKTTGASPSASCRRPLLISFSGLDGSGKSTQIEVLLDLLSDWGYRTRRLAFWDHVVVLTRYRERFVHRVFKSEAGIGAPGRPVNRRDKNMRGWHLGLARHVLYLLDSLSLRLVLARARRSPVDAIVMDRYIYDELANLPLDNRFTRTFIRLVQWIAPRPDLAYLLDADPELARARKPEYPLDFMRQCRGWYRQLAELLETMTIIPPLPLAEARREIAHALLCYLAQEHRATLPSPAGLPGPGEAGVPRQAA